LGSKGSPNQWCLEERVEMTKSLVEQYVEDPAKMRLYQQERAIFEVTDLIESVMEEQGISRTKLAELLGKTKGWVTQLLDGEANKTIRTVADVFAVLGLEYHSSAREICISNGKELQFRGIPSNWFSWEKPAGQDQPLLGPRFQLSIENK
jgi:transcriptional regulator with XRE-family HTH domain